jgi:hypothetical protein
VITRDYLFVALVRLVRLHALEPLEIMSGLFFYLILDCE